MRTLRGNNIANENGDISDSKNQAKSKKKPVDDDVGASGDETTDDEGGVDTPPPTCEEDDDSKEDEKNDLDDSMEIDQDEIKDKEKKNEEEKDEKKNDEEKDKKKNGEVKTTKKKGMKQKNLKKIKDRKNSEVEEEEYEVEQVVDMETSQRWKCPVKFRVRWVGFTEKEDSWLSASALSCDELIEEFLDISGRKSEYERAYEAKKKAAEWINENYRQSARKSTRVTYSELDEDEEEILPSGTKSRKVKTKAEKKLMPGSPVIKRKAKQSPVISPKKSKSKKEDIYEVKSITGMREVKGKVEYKVRWKNWSSKHDSWIREDELNCPELLNQFKETVDKVEKQEDWQVEKILEKREKKGKSEYLVHWKGFESKHDTWEPEENLSGCPELLNSFKSEKETKPTLLNQKRRTREEKPRTDRLAENNADSPRSRSKRRNAATSYSEFYEQ